MNDDATLLRLYCDDNSETAFAEFVQRNLPLVYAAATRRLQGDVHRAQDVAQLVFCAAARDARKLSQHAMLTGWLYTATRNAVVDVQRSESRRRTREKQAHAAQIVAADPAADVAWSQLRPVLDQALDQLGDVDRDAVLLRFFQNRSYAEIGTAVGASEEAARKRVDRALDRLRDVLAVRGVRSTSAALGLVLGGHAAAAVPTGLAASVTTAALASSGAALGAATFFGLTKLQLGLTVAVVTAGAVGLVQQPRSPSRETSNAAQSSRATGTQEPKGTAGAVSPTTVSSSPTPDTPVGPEGSSASPATSPTRVADRAVPSSSTSSNPNRGTTVGTFDLSRSAPDVPESRRAAWHQRYDPFFRERGFTAAQVERIMQLWFLQEQARFDLQAAVAEKGLRGDAPGVETLRSQLYAPITRELREIMGDDGFAAYGKYEGTSYFRLIVTNALSSVFERAHVPLAPAQIDALAGLVGKLRRSERVKSTDIGTTTRVDWTEVAENARAILTPEQLSVLQRYAASASSNR